MPAMRWLRRLLVAVAALSAAAIPAAGQTPKPEGAAPIALLAAIEGAIGPATVRHVTRVLDLAAERRAEVLILRMNTPGGLSDSMRQIISAILASPVPVVGYVAPPGAHAASAGTYILYATQIAAMAPGTNLGAATPVQIGGLPDIVPKGDQGDGQGDGKDSGDNKSAAPPPGDTLSRKATNDAVALIRSLAEMHGRNADWGEKAVREAASLSAAQALEMNVIDLVAPDVPALLKAIDGRTVTTAAGTRTLSTSGVAIETVEVDTITRILGVLSNPNVALLLMMIGFYGLIFEFWNPGSVAPGVVGAICLTLGLYALNQLPLDYAGLGLIFLGIAFMVAEALTPTFGVLGFGGLIAFVLGSAMLVDTDVPEYRVSWWLIGTMAAVSGAFLVLLLGYTVRAYRHRAPVSGDARMVGTAAEVLEWSGDGGFVWAEGERWRAAGPSGLAAGQHVHIRAIDGLTLTVAPDASPGGTPGAPEGGH